MAGNYWIKLYIEILDDPKMGHLSAEAWRLAVELFLMAGEINEGGALPTTPEIAWRLRYPCNETLQSNLKTLELAGILAETDAKTWVVVNFADRQAAIPVAERVKQHRKRKKQGKNNDDVTKSYTESESESYTETETDDDDDAPPNLTQFWTVYQTEIGGISPLISQRFGMYAEEAPVSWLIEAVEIAAENNIRKPAYVFGCLDKAIAAKMPPRQVFKPPAKPTPHKTAGPATEAYMAAIREQSSHPGVVTRNQSILPEIAAEIDQVVGEDPEDINFFKRVIVAGVRLGWNPKNINWIVEHYKRREIPGKTQKGASHETNRHSTAPAGLADRGQRIKRVADPSTGEVYWYDTRTRQRVEAPA